MFRGFNHSSTSQQFQYLFVLDVEATCVEDRNPSFKMEIIEFPIVLIDTAQQKIIDEFHSYVRPVINPVLSDFCLNLTGITQQQVDEAPVFPEVLKAFNEWASKHVDLNGSNFIFLTDGPFDIRDFVHDQCEFSAIPLPRWARRWVDMRRVYKSARIGAYKERPNLKGMLEGLSLEFEGRPHSGIDDSSEFYFFFNLQFQLTVDSKWMNGSSTGNIARIAIEHMRKGVKFTLISTLERGLREKANRHLDSFAFFG